jgi:heat shock protein HslJ
MISRKKIALSLLIGIILTVAACAPQGPGVPVTGETPVPSSTPSPFAELPPEAVLNAQQWLATQLSVAAEQVQVAEIEQAEWTDSCLGLGRANESCLQAITPGWRSVFEVNGQRYEVRTDATGSTIRLASPTGALSEGATLENTNWQLVSFGLPSAAKPVVDGSTVTLSLADGQAGGSAGCNLYAGMYQVEGESISFGEITTTLKACADDKVTDQEQHYLAALQATGRYELDGHTLRIFYDNEAGVLVFETTLAGPGAPMPTVETPDG